MPRVNDINITEGQIAYSNFAGRPTPYKPEGGVRTVTFVMPENIVDDLMRDGWKVRKQEFEDGSYRYLLEATFLFRTREGKLRDPKIFIVKKDGFIHVTEEIADTLDHAEIVSADAVIGAYYYDYAGKQGIKAYINSLYLTIKENPIDEKYRKMMSEMPSVDTDDNLPFPIE